MPRVQCTFQIPMVIVPFEMRPKGQRALQMPRKLESSNVKSQENGGSYPRTPLESWWWNLDSYCSYTVMGESNTSCSRGIYAMVSETISGLRVITRWLQMVWIRRSVSDEWGTLWMTWCHAWLHAHARY